ncbi:MmcQ/YjbR family DNA-binding protein [Streptomyces sp. NBC_00237]|uniref:MmcQ/YjbR family DNA-binding protein n=1 Tax=Streptomyces sp. NBC_00237 TaxID=2975687 RepID=UPI0022529D0A|nr:MmcQ/YjbR family DNA-binding protein [Streptomyces sp. NBC_00237]MCX5202846.1 MmcQ/YjbR family DNA-binding protein [Streptomyces sp. NBC_00237]
MTDAEDVRRVALALPDTAEKLAWGSPTFRVGGKLFAALSEDDTSVAFKCPKEERAELIQAEPEKFFVKPGHDDNYDWLRANLSALEDEEELRTVLLDSWRQAAPRKLLALHPELADPER